jgi:hypothetical protein
VKSIKDPIKLARRDLLERVRPTLHGALIATGKAHSRETLADLIAAEIRADPTYATFSHGIVARMLVDDFVEITSREPPTCDQLLLFSSAQDIRDHNRHTTFEVGDGTVIAMSSVSLDNLEALRERKRINAVRASMALQKFDDFLERTRPLMQHGMSLDDAEIQIWEELHA